MSEGDNEIFVAVNELQTNVRSVVDCVHINLFSLEHFWRHSTVTLGG